MLRRRLLASNFEVDLDFAVALLLVDFIFQIHLLSGDWSPTDSVLNPLVALAPPLTVSAIAIVYIGLVYCRVSKLALCLLELRQSSVCSRPPPGIVSIHFSLCYYACISFDTVYSSPYNATLLSSPPLHDVPYCVVYSLCTEA